MMRFSVMKYDLKKSNNGTQTTQSSVCFLKHCYGGKRHSDFDKIFYSDCQERFDSESVL